MKSVKTIALFRYHRDADVCSNRLQLFREFNPDIPVHGLYGGSEEELRILNEKTGDFFTSQYVITGVPDEWKWKNFDFILKQWYANAGKELEFDRLVLIEWDHVLYDSIENAYQHIPEDHVGFTGLVPLETVRNRWYWTKNEERAREFMQLRNHVHNEYLFEEGFMACLCPGLIMPRKLLAAMQEIDLPEYGNDELRFPLYAQIAGTGMSDTGFFRKWFSNREFRYFNCHNILVSSSSIKKQLKRANGRRSFHPVREIVEITRPPGNMKHPQ